MNNIRFLFKLLAAIGFILTASCLIALGSRDTTPVTEGVYYSQILPDTEPAAEEPSRAETVMKALAKAYPAQIEKVEYRNGDWAVLLRDTWYYFAGGCLLPENLLSRAESYSPHGFYNYRIEMPEWVTPSAEEQERLLNASLRRNQSAIRRSPHFFDALWRAGSRSESYDRVKSMRFLGNSVTVHYMIMENLALVEEEILAAAKTDAQVQTWINSIGELAGWSWRTISDTESRSYHAYGIAVDIIPRSYGGKEVYWLWTQRHKADWWNVPYSARWQPPLVVIKAFEKYGFIWGGKWLFYDNMHFEYRPELLILAGIPPETRR